MRLRKVLTRSWQGTYPNRAGCTCKKAWYPWPQQWYLEFSMSASQQPNPKSKHTKEEVEDHTGNHTQICDGKWSIERAQNVRRDKICPTLHIISTNVCMISITRNRTEDSWPAGNSKHTTSVELFYFYFRQPDRLFSMSIFHSGQKPFVKRFLGDAPSISDRFHERRASDIGTLIVSPTCRMGHCSTYIYADQIIGLPIATIPASLCVTLNLRIVHVLRQGRFIASGNMRRLGGVRHLLIFLLEVRHEYVVEVGWR